MFAGLFARLSPRKKRGAGGSGWTPPGTPWDAATPWDAGILWS
jgi:hypothetical protein